MERMVYFPVKTIILISSLGDEWNCLVTLLLR